MINNGGGIFDEQQKPNLVTPENIEAITFFQELVKKGYADPRSVGYTTANTQVQWKAGKFGMQVEAPSLPATLGGKWATDVVVGDPLTSASGKKGALFFPNNIMMYKNTPSQKGSEAFLTYYYKNMAPLWTKKTGVGLPPLKSIARDPAFAADKNFQTTINEWQPISKTWGAPGTNQVFLNVIPVDGTLAINTVTQSILGGRVTAKEALTTLQNALKSAAKPS